MQHVDTYLEASNSVEGDGDERKKKKSMDEALIRSVATKIYFVDLQNIAMFVMVNT